MARYIFVDGRHLRTYFDEAMQQFFGEVPTIDYEAMRLQASCEKLFYYDSIDAAQRVGETAEQARARVEALDTEMARIQASSGCHVREGSVTGRDQRRRRQKQVDVLLAVEMLTHAFRGNFDSAILLAGDLDFKPLLDSLVSLGSSITVRYFPGMRRRICSRRQTPGARLRLGTCMPGPTLPFR